MRNLQVGNVLSCNCKIHVIMIKSGMDQPVSTFTELHAEVPCYFNIQCQCSRQKCIT